MTTQFKISIAPKGHGEWVYSTENGDFVDAARDDGTYTTFDTHAAADEHLEAARSAWGQHDPELIQIVSYDVEIDDA